MDCLAAGAQGCSAEDGKKPDGQTQVPWTRGRALVWDFTCPDTLAPSYLANTSAVIGAAAAQAEETKNKKYRHVAARFLFVPVAVETLGTWGKEGLAFVKEVGRRLAATTGETRSASFLLQRVSLAVQRGNVASVLGTLPPGKKLEEIFLL